MGTRKRRRACPVCCVIDIAGWNIIMHAMTRVLTLTLAALSAPVLAQCVADGSAPRPRLVELYTSEGCSSCPPADAWLRTISSGANLVPLAFHVDYWDSLGWRDRYADPRYTARQQQQAARDGAGSVYTPQVVLDGRAWSGWYRGAATAAATAAGASMRADMTSGSSLHVSVTTTFTAGAEATGYRNYVALTENGLSSVVQAGENRGVTLRHDHVVRAFAGPLPLAAATDLALPADLDRHKARLIAFTQRNDGTVAQVLDCAVP
jgi:hypothetical protein